MVMSPLNPLPQSSGEAQDAPSLGVQESEAHKGGDTHPGQGCQEATEVT